MLFSGKENIFKCFVAFQKMFWKIFSGVWLCSWKYYRKHIFYLLLTFSQLPNKYIISFIPQYRNTNKTQKKISSNLVKLREEGRERGDLVWREVRSRGAVLRSWSVQRQDRDQRSAATIRPSSKGRGRSRKREISSANWELGNANSMARSCRCDWGWAAASVSRTFSLSFSLCASMSSSLYASQFRKWFEGKIKMKMLLQDQRAYFTVNGSYFPFDPIFRTNQTAYFTKKRF